MLEYIKRKQKRLEKKRQRATELEAKKEAARVAKMEAEARKQKEIVARKKFLLEQQENERLRQRHAQRKEKLVEQKWNKELDTLMAQIDDRLQKDDKLEEIKIIIQNREPLRQKLDWATWLLSDNLNQELADLDYDYAEEMFKRDNLMAEGRRGNGGRLRRPALVDNWSLTFDRATESHVTTEFDPVDYNLNHGFTVSFWVRPDEDGNHRFALGRRMASNHGRFTFGLRSTTRAFVGVGNSKKQGHNHGMEVGTWYHWAITYAGNNTSPKTLKLYIDGEEIFDLTTSWPDDELQNGIPIYFGARNVWTLGYNAGWSCGLDQVAIFDTVKDADWVTNVYNTDQKKLNLTNESGLVGYWKFNEGSGNYCYRPIQEMVIMELLLPFLETQQLIQLGKKIKITLDTTHTSGILVS